MPESNSEQQKPARRYDANYGDFQTELDAEIRREAYGEDISQKSWTTADEHDKFLGWLKLTPDKTLLDVACGAGGLALRAAAVRGCSVTGVDIHERAIVTANSLAAERDSRSEPIFKLQTQGIRNKAQRRSYELTLDSPQKVRTEHSFVYLSTRPRRTVREALGRVKTAWAVASIVVATGGRLGSGWLLGPSFCQTY